MYGLTAVPEYLRSSGLKPVFSSGRQRVRQGVRVSRSRTGYGRAIKLSVHAAKSGCGLAYPELCQLVDSTSTQKQATTPDVGQALDSFTSGVSERLTAPLDKVPQFDFSQIQAQLEIFKLPSSQGVANTLNAQKPALLEGKKDV